MTGVSAGMWSVDGDDFGARTLTTTSGYKATSGTSFFQIGVDAGSGATTNSSASIGGLRFPRGGGDGAALYGRSNDDLSDVPIVRWDSTGPTMMFGSATSSVNTSLRALTNILLNINTSNMLSLTTAQIRWAPPAMSFLPGTVDPSITQENLSGGTTQVGHTLTIHAQITSGTVSATGGAIIVAAGDSTGTAIGIGGLATFRGGDYTGATTPQGGDALVRSGDGPGHIRGNISFGDLVPNAQGMRNGIYISNMTALATAAPAGGIFFGANGGVPRWRTSANDVVEFTSTSSASASGGAAAIPALAVEYLAINYNGNVRKLALFAA